MTAEPGTFAANRRAFLAGAAASAIGSTAAVLMGAAVAAADSGGLPDYAPIPPEAFGPNLNANRGYFVGRIDGNLYRVSDSFYQAMFLTAQNGVVWSTPGHHPDSEDRGLAELSVLKKRQLGEEVGTIRRFVWVGESYQDYTLQSRPLVRQEGQSR